MSKPTPGPYVILDHDENETIYIAQRGDPTHIIGCVYSVVNFLDIDPMDGSAEQIEEECEATAKLWRSAPDMAQAIRALLKDYDAGTFEQYASLHPSARRHFDALRMALVDDQSN